MLRGSSAALAFLFCLDAAAAEVKLGMAGPITGANAGFGAQLKNGVEQAVADINRAGGILGETIIVFVGGRSVRPETRRLCCQ
jgi:branched-chain amino acid transport system substrate-binding protein